MIPIFQITANAMWFVFANAFSLVRVSWMPMTALIAATYGLAYGVVEALPGVIAADISDTEPYMLAAVTEALLSGIVLSVIAVHVHRMILFGDRRPGVYFAFPFGRTEALYFIMGLLTILTFVVVVLTPAIVYGIAMDVPLETLLPRWPGEESDTVSLPSDPMVIALAIAARIVIVIGLYWIMLRLTLWPPAVVATNRFALREALQLSKGRALALLGVLWAAALSYVVVAIGLIAAVNVAGVQAGYDLVAAYEAMSLHAKIASAAAGQPVDAFIVAFEFVYRLTAIAYGVAILSYTYKSLTSEVESDEASLHFKPMNTDES